MPSPGSGVVFFLARRNSWAAISSLVRSVGMDTGSGGFATAGSFGGGYAGRGGGMESDRDTRLVRLVGCGSAGVGGGSGIFSIAFTVPVERGTLITLVYFWDSVILLLVWDPETEKAVFVPW